MNQFLGDKLRTTDIAGLNYDEFPNILDVKFLYTMINIYYLEINIYELDAALL